MILAETSSLLAVETMIFLTIVLMHMVRKTSYTIYLYVIQSVLTVGMMGSLLLDKVSLLLLFAIVLTFLIKVIFAPIFFFKMIKKCQLIFSVDNYLNLPITLIVITIITLISHSTFFKPFIAQFASTTTDSMLFLSLSIILIALFLIVNQKCALSQIIGVLSLENGIVAFSSITGLEQSSGIQIAIIFNIFIWIVIATVFTSMLFKHFGSVSMDKLTGLKE